ncbi:MAG: hypothetical protein ACE5H4_04040 [Candidatus Thorarchaeota archaeon]
MQTETREEQLANQREFKPPPLWILGPILYLVGVVLSFFTDNFQSFLLDYPWACFLLASQ